MTIKFTFLLPNCVEKKIIIVGAGIAGLFCAKELLKHGFQNVLILEASNRIGGRIHSHPVEITTDENEIEKFTIDTGPQRISRGLNSIYELASHFDLLNKNNPDYCEALKKLDNVYKKEEENIISELVFYFSQLYYFPKTCEEILENEEFLEKFGHCDQSLIKKYVRGVYDWHRSFVYEFSFLPADLRKGYHELLKLISKNIPNGWIRLNKEVINIDWTEVMPNPTGARSKNPKIKIQCRYESRHYEADHVIITVPLGYLKQNAESLFIPPLPEPKMNAIKSLDFVTFNKIYLVFDEPFWNIPDVFHVMWNEALEKLFCKDDESSQGQKEWVRCITHFEYVAESPYILLACVWNEGAEIMENLSVERVIQDCMKLLEHLLQKSLPEVKAIVRSSWHSNPFFLGSLPYDPSRDAGADISKIAETVFGGSSGTQPVLLFAGDATTKMDLACVHGAAASGVRAACALYAYYRYGRIV